MSSTVQDAQDLEGNQINSPCLQGAHSLEKTRQVDNDKAMGVVVNSMLGKLGVLHIN